MTENRYLTARQAADLLDISLPTLYAYVSRGLIRSESADESKRQRRYYREDVDKLLLKKEATRNPEKMAESALHWGAPVLDSTLTLILDGKLYYRGQDVAELARTESLEAVATWLWAEDRALWWELFTTPNAAVFALPDFLLTQSPYTRLQCLLPLAAVQDFAAYDLRLENVMQTGARILNLMVSALTPDVAPAPAKNSIIAERLATAWSPSDNSAAEILNAALIVCADHELNASSFTARIVASTGANPYAVVTAGLAALTGVKHGGSTERVDAFLNELSTANDIRQGIAARLRRGDPIPGFGHKLYPLTDPRAAILFDLMRGQGRDLQLFDAICEGVLEVIGEYPNVDFALVTLARVLNLPPESALTLFALGRTIGWIAHALEQYRDDALIRPRARYVGNQPSG